MHRSHFSSRHTTHCTRTPKRVQKEQDRSSQVKSDKNRLPIPPLINPHLQVLLSLNIATDNRPRSAGVLIRKQSGLLLHVVFVFVVSEEAQALGWYRWRGSGSRGRGGGRAAAAVVVGEGADDVVFADGAGAATGGEPGCAVYMWLGF
jgi:hypothetical protein